MGAATEGLPKCLTELAGMSLLEWQLAALREAGVESVSAIGGYRASQLAPFVDIAAVNERWQESNMVSSLLCAAELLRGNRCLVCYSDIVYHYSIIENLLKAKADIVITGDADWLSLWAERFEDPLSDAETFRTVNGRLTKIGGRAATVEEIEAQYMGILSFTPAGWRNVEACLSGLEAHEIAHLDMTALLARMLNDNIEIEVVEVRGKWCEVDSRLDAEIFECCLERHALDNTKWSHDWR